MASEPVPTRHFETWGQVLIRIKRGNGLGAVNRLPGGIILLFAISDKDRQWLAWYAYNDNRVMDTVLMSSSSEGEAPHHVYGKYCHHPRHFSTPKPITVEEFAGPVLYSRGRKRKDSLVRRANIYEGYRNLPDTTDILVEIPHDIGPLRFHVSVNPSGKWHKDAWEYAFDDEDITHGFIGYLMSEPFNYPVPHLNVRKRLNFFEHMLTT